MSCIVVFLVFGVLNTKYLAFRTPYAGTLILGWPWFFIFCLGKLQITPLKFGDDWIFHLEVLEFEFYP